MKCPACGFYNTEVTISRKVQNNEVVRRKRSCLKCSFKFTTYEYIAVTDCKVVKRDGSFEAFDKDKLARGIKRACEKRAVDISKIDTAVNEIVAHLSSSQTHEISSKTLGEMVLEKLSTLDEVAYIRFASVYYDFSSLDNFYDELKKIERKSKVLKDQIPFTE